MERRRFLTGLGLAAAAASIGGTSWLMRPYLTEWLTPEPRWTPFDALTADDWDVCIIGSGPAGAVLGRDLVAQGIRTLILESGAATAEQLAGSRIQHLDAYRVEGNAGYPLAATRARTPGGTSTMWTGRCSRLHPLDFEPNAYTPPGAEWPVRYDELRPYYARAERTLRVHGGRLSHYHAPRRDPLPPAEEPTSGALKALLEGIGITTDLSPTSVGAYGPGPVRARTDLLPAFTESTSGTLVAGATVERLATDAGGRVAAVEVRSLDGRTATLHPGVVVVACGGVESARLLLRSRSARFPAGPGNAGDQVGRSFMEHPNITLRGVMPEPKPDDVYELVRCHQFYDAFKRRGLGSVILRFIWLPGPERVLRIGATAEMRPRPENRITLDPTLRDGFGGPAAKLDFGFSDDDRRTLDAARTLIRDTFRRLGARDLSEEPMSWSHHHVGSCRMGDDPRTSVVDRDLRVHGSRNLYVLSSAVFVTAGAAHPTLLITALAHRLGRHLAARLRPGGVATTAAGR
ncbi:MAG TPA: GMC family oxidoreductase [Longimicrobiales bacterium]